MNNESKQKNSEPTIATQIAKQILKVKYVCIHRVLKKCLVLGVYIFKISVTRIRQPTFHLSVDKCIVTNFYLVPRQKSSFLSLTKSVFVELSLKDTFLIVVKAIKR